MNDIQNIQKLMSFKPIANDVFNKYYYIGTSIFLEDANSFLNPINRSCIIEIGNYDFIGNTYGEYIFPNIVKINLCSIIKAAYAIIRSDKQYDAIMTALMFTIMHECGHSEQKLYMPDYKKNEIYDTTIESINDSRTFLYMMINKEYLEKKYNFKMDFTIVGLPGTIGNYIGYSKEQLLMTYNAINDQYYFASELDLICCYMNNLIKNRGAMELIIGDHKNVTILFYDGSYYECDIMKDYKCCNCKQFILELYSRIKKFNIVNYTFDLNEDKKTNTVTITINILHREYRMITGG